MKTANDISKQEVVDNMRKNGFPKCEAKALYFYVNDFDKSLPATIQERYNWRTMQIHFAWAFEKK